MSSTLRPLLDRIARSPVPRAAAMAFALIFILARWDPVTGYTSLMRFGEKFADRRLPVLQTLPIAPSRGDGYDGQFYAQIAVQPNVTDPALAHALDKPSYRPRRILVPVLAHLLGGGNPWFVLQAYALLHAASWLALAVVLWRLLPPLNWRATAGWAGAVLGTGALDSMRMTLTDLPAALFLVLAAMAVERGRPVLAGCAALAAGLTREVSLLGALLLRWGPAPSPLRTFVLRAVATGPVLLWCAWLAWRLPGFVGHEGNLNWPGFAFAQEWWRQLNLLLGGRYDSQWLYCVLAGPALAAQSVYLLRQWRDFTSNPWIALGLPFAVLFWLIGTDPWLDYRAVARDCLPMTIVFNLHWARRPEASPWWLLANLPVIDGLQRMTWTS